MPKPSPLKPTKNIVFITSNSCTRISPSKIRKSKIGAKAFGLACLPPHWTLPFLVISDSLFQQYKEAFSNKGLDIVTTWSKKLFYAAVEHGIAPNDKIIIRSSACDEDLPTKGEYYSNTGTLSEIATPLSQCLDKLLTDNALPTNKIPLILQKHPNIVSAKGHLSNERRFAKEMRDWAIEFEKPKDLAGHNERISLRSWRRNKSKEVNPEIILACKNFFNLPKILEDAAAWALSKQSRIHFEWIWDGDCVYLVQADEALEVDGIHPRTLKVKAQQALPEYTPRCLSVVNPTEKFSYNKIFNVYQYNKLGLPTTRFYILQDRKAILDLTIGNVSCDLAYDISVLSGLSLVIRMDVTSQDKRIRQLLPRTNEVRNLASALSWFAEQKNEIHKLVEHGLALIFHNFIPAAASAFAYAVPNARKVQIEALWGLPEGLYYFSHDKYIVDTRSNHLSNLTTNDYSKFFIEKKINFKNLFVTPDDEGKWVTKNLHSSFGWGGTITDKSTLASIAHATRMIAEEAQEPLSVMWLVGVDQSISKNGILPWYHEPADINQRQPRTSYKPKTLFDKGIEIKNVADLERLEIEVQNKTTMLRYISIQPREDRLLRDKLVLKRIGECAKKIDAVIYLEGGILSHAYYQLVKTDAHVQVALPFGATDNRINFDKLVRDYIPSKIEEGGEQVKKAKFSGEYLLRLLKDKLVEECFEVLDANNHESIIEELADVNEVIDTILKTINSNRHELAEYQENKAQKAGGFSEGYVLLETTNPLPTSKQKDSSGMLPTSTISNTSIIKDANIYDILEKGRKVKKWHDRRLHSPETEDLFSLEVPVVKDFWEEETPETFFAIFKGYAVRAKVMGRRQGAKLKIRFSVYTIPKQLSLLDLLS
ncbi:MAG: hypothetical protein PWQ57_1741 [Desulfovibrionales bacterium]|nr:hypothetical protein [Desulfovibrionales bacterium]